VLNNEKSMLTMMERKAMKTQSGSMSKPSGGSVAVIVNELEPRTEPRSVTLKPEKRSGNARIISSDIFLLLTHQFTFLKGAEAT
jgi:hypothetical protein